MATLIGATRSTGPAALVAAQPHDVELALLEDALGVLVDLVDGGAGDLAGAVGLLPGRRLEVALDGAGRVAHPRQGEADRVGDAEHPPLLERLER